MLGGSEVRNEPKASDGASELKPSGEAGVEKRASDLSRSSAPKARLATGFEKSLIFLILRDGFAASRISNVLIHELMSLYQNNPILQEYEKQAMALEEKQKEIDKLKQETEELERRIEILCRMDSQETHTIQELNAIIELLEEPNFLTFDVHSENIDGKEENIYGFPDTEENPIIGISSTSIAQIEDDEVVTVKFGDHGPVFLKDDIVTVKFEENGTVFLGNSGNPTKCLIEEDWSPSLFRDIHSSSPESFSLARSPSPESVTSVRSPGRCEDEKIAAESPVPRVPEEPPYEAPDYTFTCHETAINSPGSSSYHRDDEAVKCVRKFLKRERGRRSRDSAAIGPLETGLYPNLPEIDDWTTTELYQDEELVQETSEIVKNQEDDELVNLPSILIPEILPEDDDHESIMKAARRLQLVGKHVVQDVPSSSVRNDRVEENNIIVLEGSESGNVRDFEELSTPGQILPETILEEVPPSLKSDVMEKRKPVKERKTSKKKTKKRKDENSRFPIVSDNLWPIDHQSPIHRSNDCNLKVVPVTRNRKTSTDADNEEWVGMEIAIRNSLESQESGENGDKVESLAPPSNTAKRATKSKNEEGSRDGFSRKSRERKGRKSKKSLMILPQELCGTDNFLSFLATLTSQEIVEKETGLVESETSTAATASSTIMNQETTEETEISRSAATALYLPQETILYMGGSHYDDVMTVLSDDRSRWTRARIKMPGSLISGAAICVNQEIYLLGGFPNNKSLQKLDIRTREWVTLAEMNVGRVLIQKSTVEMNGFIWVLGGEDSRGKALKSVELYDPRLDVWAKIRDMNYARSRAAATVWNEKIFICGGIGENSDDNSCLKSVECFDPESGVWTLLVDMPAALCDHTLLTYKNRLILMGGRFGSILTTAIAELEEENGRWKPAEKMPDVPMATGIVLDDEIYALGGLDELQVATRRVEIFDGNRWRWSTSLPYTWNHSYCIVVPRELAQSLCE